MKKNLIFSFLFFLMLNASSAFAVPEKRYDPATQTCRSLTFFNSGWLSEGRDIFENSCKGCHHRGNDQGAPFLHAESKTMKGWNRVFAKRYPECASNGSWADLSQDAILKLNDFLYRNAWGTYDPNNAESCG
jgi:cytochrome c5